MIATLHIKNIGIIDDLTIDFNEGFNVLTGETGAGKTLIIGSLGILCGGRFSKDMIRRGENVSLVEASIFCPDSFMAIDGNIIVSREIYATGRNTCKVNGRLVTVNELKEVMSKVIDIHGQQDNYNLLDATKHICYLDGFIGSTIQEIKEKYQNLYTQYNKIKLELEQNYGDDKEKQRKLDLLYYQFNEIDRAKLKKNEEEELEEKHNQMKNAEKLQENMKILDENLNNGVIDGISNCVRCLEKIEDYGAIYGEKLIELKNIYYDVQELSRDITNMQEETYFDEDEINNVEERLNEISSLKRKYGNSIEEILKYRDEIGEEIHHIENIDEINEQRKREKQNIEKEMNKLCIEMGEIRQKFAIKLSEKINKELKDLEMSQAHFSVRINQLSTNEYNKNGLNQVEFYISTNKGEEEKELIKIASGGEMSRIMLAIKTVLTDVDRIPVLIFDEIDTGISGKAAKAVAEKMKIISENHQILCVTHLASIAAKGDYNYYISKNVKGEKTVTSIRKLNEEEVIKEIARIANGDITEVALQNAKELRKVG